MCGLSYRTPDQALRRYHSLKEQLSSVPAYNLAVASGKAVAAACKACGHGLAYFVTSKKQVTTRRCGNCNALWPSLDADAVKGEVRMKRRLTQLDSKHAELAGLALVFTGRPEGVCERVWRVYMGLWALYAVGGHSYQTISEKFGEELVRIGRGPSRDTVRRVIAEARSWCAGRLGL